MPLLAGICTPEQEERSLNHLQSSHGFCSRIGLSAVDQSAPYYRHDGFWNGKPAAARAAASGTLQITLPRDSGRGSLKVEVMPA